MVLHHLPYSQYRAVRQLGFPRPVNCFCTLPQSLACCQEKMLSVSVSAQPESNREGCGTPSCAARRPLTVRLRAPAMADRSPSAASRLFCNWRVRGNPIQWEHDIWPGSLLMFQTRFGPSGAYRCRGPVSTPGAARESHTTHPILCPDCSGRLVPYTHHLSRLG
jgi:hypothetical protein